MEATVPTPEKASLEVLVTVKHFIALYILYLYSSGSITLYLVHDIAQIVYVFLNTT